MKLPASDGAREAACLRTIASVRTQDVWMAGGAEAGDEYPGDRHAGIDQLLARGRPTIEEPPVRATRPADA
jgi:hypothetical protein